MIAVLFSFIKAYSWPCKANNIKCFAKTVNG